MVWLVFALIGLCILFLLSFLKKITSNDTSSLFHKIEKLWSGCRGLKDGVSYRYGNLSRRKRNDLIREIRRSYDNIQKNYERIISYKIDNINNGERWIVDNINIIEREYKLLQRYLEKNDILNLPVYRNRENKELGKYPRILLLAMRYVKNMEKETTKENIIKEFESRGKKARLCYRELNFLKASLSFSLIQGISELSKEIALMTEEEEYAAKLFQEIKEKEIEEEKFLKLIEERMCKNKFFFINKILMLLREESENNVYLYNILNSFKKISNINEEAIVLKVKDFIAKNEEKAQIYLKSLNFIDKLQWESCITKMSYVEKALCKDPSGVYSKMDLETKKLYRKRIEELSRKLKVSEFEIIDTILRKCIGEKEKIKSHVGYYIIDSGRKSLLQQYRKKEFNPSKKIKVKVYIAANIFMTIVFIAVLLRGVYAIDAEKNLFKYILPFIILIPSFSQLSLTLINWGISLRKEPQIIPKIDYSKGIDSKIKTCVVIPCMFNKEEDIDELIQKMEIYYLGNKEKGVYFALLADFLDSKKENVPKDEKLITHAEFEIKKINRKYSEKSKFNIFMRKRIFNNRDNYWMGWERKRGKLSEFNRLIRGEGDTTFNTLLGDIEELRNSKYIITLDEDTFLPLGGCGKLVGAMEHILNQPVYDSEKRQVTRGYSIIQPRISINHESHHKTFFSRIFSGEIGFDIYTRAVSDIYQDVFKEGIFTGKGIYNVDMFEDILQKEIPNYSVLSHDLIEGSFVKCGLATDIEFIDSYPANYYSFSKRLHRWVRGDWQLVKFLKRKNLSLLNKFQMLDNMRRSLVAPSIVAIMIFSLMNILPNDKGVWLVAALISYITPVLINISELVFLKAKTYGLLYESKNYRNTIERIVILIAFIPYNAYSMVDAIVRTIYRVFVSNKNLLQWTPASRVEKRFVNGFRFYLREMFFAPIFAVVVMITAYFHCVDLMIYYLFPCGLWFVSPFIAYSISKECINKEDTQITEKEELYLRRIARKTWAFFEDNVNESNNYLGIDNIQIEPKAECAERTSPTNIGMVLTSNICAYDLGYISLIDLVERIEKTIESVSKLEKHSGHLYNWYDVSTMEPLEPKFISTVDSGNMVSYLYLIKRFLEKSKDYNIPNKNRLKGLRDTLELLNIQYEPILGDKALLSNAFHKIQSQEEEINFSNAEDTIRYLTNILRELDQITAKDYWRDKIEGYITSLKREKEYFVCGDFKDSETKNITLNRAMKSGENKWETACELSERIDKLIISIDSILQKSDFKKLYNRELGLFSIGYDVTNEKLSENYYDLIASEARMSSFIAIAKGDVPLEHWFKLGRNLFMVGDKRVFASWSGTTFEYCMPSLLLKDFKGSAFAETIKGVVKAQKKFGDENEIPFGISESGYYSFDVNDNYQYKAFGTPSLAMKNILNPDLVISPYSTFLMMLADKKLCITNLNKLREIGMEGKYGFYEAVDFTKRRMKRDRSYEKIKSFMIHHQGMSLMALDNILNEDILRELFHSIPNIKSMERMLNEKIPNSIIFDNKKKSNKRMFREEKKEYMRKYRGTTLVTPQVQAMSNEKMQMLMSYSGRGESRCGDVCLNYYNRDYVMEEGGILFYINVDKKNFWGLSDIDDRKGINGEVVFKHNDATFFTNSESVFVKYSATLDNNEPLEYRIVEVDNRKDRECEIELYGYNELILSEVSAHEAHPAFGKLFMSTMEQDGVVLCKRKGKSENEKDIYGFTYIVGEGKKFYQTDKRAIVPRGEKFENNPQCLTKASFNDKVGDVLHPVFSHKVRFKLGAGEKRKIIFCYGVSESLDDISRIHSRQINIDDVESSVRNFDQRSFKNLEIMDVSSNNYSLIMNICSRLVFQKRNRNCELVNDMSGTQQDLWKFGISGDFPIVILEINKIGGIMHFNQLIKTQQYLKVVGIQFDLIIVCKEQKGYNQPLREAVFNEIESMNVGEFLNIKGGLYVKNYYEIKEDIHIFKYVSVLMFNDEEGPLFIQIPYEKHENNNIDDIDYNESMEHKSEVDHEVDKAEETLKFYNGYGGFAENGKVYEVILKGKRNTPSPWCNVISGDNMGFIVSERGTMYTWYDNSREFKLTPWNNDEISDIGEEYLYLMDMEKKNLFTITKAPLESNDERKVKHGVGYSQFEYSYDGVEFNMTVFMNKKDTVKHITLKINNKSSKTRRFKASYYASLVMGVHERKMQRYIKTRINKNEEYIYAQNPYNTFYKNTLVFLKTYGGENHTFTGDRYEVLKGGNVSMPIGIIEDDIFENDGYNDSNCLFDQFEIYIPAGKEKSVEIILGAGESVDEVEEIIHSYKCNDLNYEFIRNKNYWSDLINEIQVKTPDESFNILMNNWLIYQVLSCRFKGRTAFYQCGGAYGFRDQLQDLVPISYYHKEMVREYILKSSKKMFKEGDVLHWWHDRMNSGIRTRFSDDLLWLPYSVAMYVQITGDNSILEEETTFLEGEELIDGENEKYSIFESCDEKDNILNKCITIIRRVASFGIHDIPLMGCGDWNDGMNGIGPEGKGESVWLGEFLYHTTEKFIGVFEKEMDKSIYKEFEDILKRIKKGINENAWDGEWYKRAFFDDGTPLGSKDNEDCKIDIISQAWSVISGVGEKDKCKKAMESVDKHLVDNENGLIRLLYPPFDKGREEPGYIKGYVKGVRENGGQYSHGVVWGIIASNIIGDKDKALKLFSMINPIKKTEHFDYANLYTKEPYVMCGDVYSNEENNGYGGWSWYTGSAAWMYRCGLEEILGFSIKDGNRIEIKSGIPSSWDKYEVKYRHKNAVYKIIVKRGKEKGIFVNGEKKLDNEILLHDNGNYEVNVLI